MYTYKSNAAMLSRVFFYLKSVNFHFLFSIVCKLNEEKQTHILLSVYVLRGCGACCALCGIRRKILKIMMNNSKELQEQVDIDREHAISLTARLACVSVIGLLYGCNVCMSLNKLQVNRVLEDKKVKPRKVHPTDDSLILHLPRCNYQIMIWRESLTSVVELPSPIDYGHAIDTGTGHNMPQMVSQPIAPSELLNDLVCFCFTHCLHLNALLYVEIHLKECHLRLTLKEILQNTAFHLCKTCICIHFTT